MILKRYFIEGLAHASYLFGADGQAAVVDPKRDVDDYIADAEREGMQIVAVLNSHPHADFASGFPELARRIGWQSIPAVRTGRVISDIDPDTILRPGPRLISGVKALSERLYPEQAGGAADAEEAAAANGASP